MKNREELFQYWQDNIWYGSGKGYEGVGRSFEDQVDMFNEWLADQMISNETLANITDLDEEINNHG
jgi:hypothetical protein